MKRRNSATRTTFLGLALLAASTAAGGSEIFPFPIHERALANGLKVVVIPYDSPGTVAFVTVVRTGSRDEVEPGHSGFAHFFEHMMFRGTPRYSQEAYNEVLKRMGADSNATTSDDRTLYYIVGPAAELETMMDIESDRFQNLSYSEDDFRREALAVLGEYNKSVSSPSLPMFERMRDLAFQRHTYKHTTIGFLEDIQAMPEEFEYSLSFFDRFYRPDNSILLVVGDAEPERVLALAERYYGGWERGYQAPSVEVEPEAGGPAAAHLEWPTPIRPHLMVGYRVPAFSAERPDSAALDAVSELLFSESAPLYQKLVVEEQWVDTLSGAYSDHRDPYLFVVFARLKSTDLVPRVQGAITDALAGLAGRAVEDERLARVKSHLANRFALDLDDPGAVAFAVSSYLSLTGDPRTLHRVFEQYERLTPEDVRRVAGSVFTDVGRTSITLAHAGNPLPEGAAPPDIETVLLPSASTPLVALRLQFSAGSIHDPPGKEGLAALTGLMVGEAGTRQRSYRQILEDLYPLAASLEVTTDREVTVMSGEIHRDSLGEFTRLLAEVVGEPGFAEDDFRRNKERLLAYLTDTLRASNDELLGLEYLQQVVFSDHPYGHAPAGTVQGLAGISLDDVRDFHARHYTRGKLVVGIAGGYPEGYPETLTSALASLPEGEAAPVALPTAPRPQGRQIVLVEKATDSVGIHFGFPLPVTRSHPDYYPLMVANSFLGEHRTFHGRLMQQLRGERGLNYGDYSYIEYWHNPPFTSHPTPGVPRRQQFFSVWVRPVVPGTAHFALRNALYELERLLERGLTQEELDLTRDFLVNYSKLWGQTLSARLGFLMDSRFYGMDPYIEEIEARLASVTVDEVNAAVRRHLTTDDLHVVIVTSEAAPLEARLQADQPSPMTYGTPPRPEVLEADAAIQALPIRPASITVVPVGEVFER